ncbi:MAG: hypothetical protein ACR2IE_13105 [Candidatus Sumerlaeaceae bacterium]
MLSFNTLMTAWYSNNHESTPEAPSSGRQKRFPLAIVAIGAAIAAVAVFALLDIWPLISQERYKRTVHQIVKPGDDWTQSKKGLHAAGLDAWTVTWTSEPDHGIACIRDPKLVSLYYGLRKRTGRRLLPSYFFPGIIAKIDLVTRSTTVSRMQVTPIDWSKP